MEKPVERGPEHNHGLLAALAFSFVSFHLIQSETTQHAKLKLAGKKGVSEYTGRSIRVDGLSDPFAAPQIEAY